MIHRGFRFRLSPTPEQEVLFQQFAGVCRLVYNLGLEQRRDFYRQFEAKRGRPISFFTQCEDLKPLRAEFDWIAAVSNTCEVQALRDLDMAFRRFFRGLAQYPKSRRKGINDTFRFQGREVSTGRLNSKWSKVRLPKIGWVKYRDTRPVAGDIRTATVTCDAGDWYVSFSCQINHEAPDSHLPAVGIDRGVANTLALSTGELLSIPASLFAIDQKQRRAQRAAARGKRGSERNRVAKKRVAALSARRARIRLDWHHKTSLSISQRFGVVAIEDLKVTNMTASGRGKHGLNRSILNQGWFAFETILAYKLEERGGRLIKVDPAYTSQSCSECGTIDRESRKSQASFICLHCGFEAHADTNAATNILRRNTASMRAEGGRKLPGEARTGLRLTPHENLRASA